MLNNQQSKYVELVDRKAAAQEAIVIRYGMGENRAVSSIIWMGGLRMPKIEIQDDKNDHLKVQECPDLLFAGTVFDEKLFYGPPQVHDYCEILYVVSGSGEFTINGILYTVRTGDLILYNEGVSHEEHSNPADPIQLVYCGLTRVQLEGLPSGKMLPAHLDPVLPCGPFASKVEGILSDILQECRSQILGYETMCRAYLMTLITLIYRLVDSRFGYDTLRGKNEISLRTKAFIDQNYTRSLTLKEIADTFYINQHYLSHLFRKDLGDSPINYLIHRRMEEAKRLLSTSSLTIREIGAAVGYENDKYFSILFKKTTGLTPSMYRRTVGKVIGE